MTFRNPRSDRDVRGFVYRRLGSNYSTLSLRAKNIRFEFDSMEMQTDLRQRWEERGSDSATQFEFLGRYLVERFAMRIEFVVSDETDSTIDPVTIPFTYFYPVARRSGILRYEWIESDLLPFSKMVPTQINGDDVFAIGSEWLCYGGAHQSIKSASLDVNEKEYVGWIGGGRRALRESGIDTVRAVIRVVDLGAPSEAEVLRFEREWSLTFEDVRAGTRVELTAR